MTGFWIVMGLLGVVLALGAWDIWNDDFDEGSEPVPRRRAGFKR